MMGRTVCGLVLTIAAQGHDITAKVTWSREISRLMAKHCATCHRDGGSAFPLSTFQQVQPKAAAIAKAVSERRMPPFGAVKGFGELMDDQSLTQEQIELISNWVASGAPEGDPTYLPKEPVKTAPQKIEPQTGPEWVAVDQKRLATTATFSAIRARALPEGASIRVVAQKPNGVIEPLIWFYRYDPKFARTYFFRKPVTLPAGTRILMSAPDATVALLTARAR